MRAALRNRLRRLEEVQATENAQPVEFQDPLPNGMTGFTAPPGGHDDLVTALFIANLALSRGRTGYMPILTDCMKPLSKKRREWIKRQLAAIKAGEELRQIEAETDFLLGLAAALPASDPLTQKIRSLAIDSKRASQEPEGSEFLVGWLERRAAVLQTARRRIN